jgi:hypothetical protein
MTYPHNDYDLTEYDDDYRNAEAPDMSTDEVPPGKYQAVVERAYIDGPNDYSPWHQLKLTCKIVSGPHAGRALFPGGTFNPEYIQYLKGTVSKMGLDPAPKTASDIQHALPDMIGRVLEIAVVSRKNNPEKRNYYVNRFVQMADSVDSDPGEDVPF